MHRIEIICNRKNTYSYTHKPEQAIQYPGIKRISKQIDIDIIRKKSACPDSVHDIYVLKEG